MGKSEFCSSEHFVVLLLEDPGDGLLANLLAARPPEQRSHILVSRCAQSVLRLGHGRGTGGASNWFSSGRLWCSGGVQWCHPVGGVGGCSGF